MDIYEFFRSADIAEHCQKINHVFNPLDMAIIVALSYKPLRVKHKAYRRITAEYPDMPIHDCVNFSAQDSLRDYLGDLMDYEDRAVRLVTAPADGVVFRAEYTYQRKLTHYESPDTHESGNDAVSGCFSTFEKAKAALMKEDYWKEGKVTWAVIRRVYVDLTDEDDDADRRFLSHHCVYLNKDGEIRDVEYYEEGKPDSLTDIFFDLPLPFKKGDLVTIEGETRSPKPCVIYNLPRWRKLGDTDYYADCLNGKHDSSNMHADVYFFEDGGLRADWGPPYMTRWLTYFRGELKGRERFLEHLGKFMAEDDHGLDWLISAYMRYHAEAENVRQKEFCDRWFVPLVETFNNGKGDKNAEG